MRHHPKSLFEQTLLHCTRSWFLKISWKRRYRSLSTASLLNHSNGHLLSTITSVALLHLRFHTVLLSNAVVLSLHCIWCFIDSRVIFFSAENKEKDSGGSVSSTAIGQGGVGENAKPVKLPPIPFASPRTQLFIITAATAALLFIYDGLQVNIELELFLPYFDDIGVTM